MSTSTDESLLAIYCWAVWHTGTVEDSRFPGKTFSLDHVGTDESTVDEMMDDEYEEIEDFLYCVETYIKRYRDHTKASMRDVVIDFHMARNGSMVAFPGEGGASLRLVARSYGPAFVRAATNGTNFGIALMRSGKPNFVQYDGEYEEDGEVA